MLKNNIYVSDFIPRYKGNGDLLNPPTFAEGQDQRNWVPIGVSYTNRFSGIFNGNGHEISGIYINTNTNDQGVFGNIVNGSIGKLGLVNSYIKGKEYAGGITGYIKRRNNHELLQRRRGVRK